ncbi:sugar kinases, ribokinase family [Anaerolinea thermolimosa]|nr:sugar kinases, ribokinase family [Anaerolinea thermolimosa]
MAWLETSFFRIHRVSQPMDEFPSHIRYLVIGRLTRRFMILPEDRVLEDIPGGSMLYTAAGISVWDTGVGLVGRVGCDYPDEWIKKCHQYQLDTRGIRRLEEPVDLREFIVYPDLETRLEDQPVAHYARLQRPFPPALLGYTPPNRTLDDRIRPRWYTIRPNDFPDDYFDATAAHIAPLDYLSHTLVPPLLRQKHIHTITLETGNGYTDPAFWDDLPVLLHGLTAFLITEDALRNLARDQVKDLWELAEMLASWGCEMIVIKRPGGNQLVYEHSSHGRWIIPPYPSRIRCPDGAGDAFNGGFLAGFRTTYDPVQAALQGNISASVVMESPDPFYAFGVLPGLPQARMESLRDMVRRA